MTTRPATITVSDLTRRFGDRTVVDAVSFTVPEGLMTGFVGGNGAGKTTTMRMIMGVLGIHGGEVRWGDHPVTTAERRRIGYMPEERGLYPKQKILEQLVYLASLKGVDPGEAKGEAQGLLERFGLGDRAGDTVEKLSLGNQQRVQIIAAVMSRPAALVLDEPFSGLDPAAVDSMADLLREQTARGVPVLFSSHQLDLVERLCDRLVVLAAGQVRAEGTTEELRSQGPVRYRLTLAGDAGWVRAVPGVHCVDIDGPTALLELDPGGAPGGAAGVDPADERVDHLLREGLARGGVRELVRVVPPLSAIYREVTA
ncbi:ATP-binding cassette domain-containing protein [Janibacter sp. YIM B02568]|jgi:ABC-2 type transport system ATP-binding protein|uniref:ABC transporter ATP-binding protein n=1 Tax=Janibacter endophyticus TaxID=2806261 RepID=UPI00194EAF1F|nr:ATP-binding cassette domain-containing protein [Janibacter endophyticus]MBM6545188.1 ATP-binding cassette domain-containing protein [Janibacter endophyticus]